MPLRAVPTTEPAEPVLSSGLLGYTVSQGHVNSEFLGLYR
jgi:hypothetical protein